MPNQVVPVTGLDTIGLIEDIPPVSLPPNAFSDCRNVRFRDGAVQKVRGDVDIFPNIIYGDSDVLKYIVWWPNPNLAVNNQGYYLLIVNRGDNDIAYMIKADQAPATVDIRNTNIPEYKGTFTGGGNWQHTFFQGGFALIINNGLDDPHYVLDDEDNTDVANVGGGTTAGEFDPLPNWDSYAVGSETVNSVTAGVIRTYGDFLIAGNLVERDSNGDVVRALPNTIRTSDIAAPGDIPQNWNPFEVGANTADEFVVTGDGIVQDFVELQGNMYVYSNSSISVISRTGNAVTPFSVRPVTSAHGALTTDAVIEFDGRHFVVGSQDIYVFAGHPGSISSVGDAKVRDAFYRRLNTIDLMNLFVIRYRQQDEIWLCYPSQEATDGRADEALIWNYRNNTWTKRDINGAFAGVVGPTPGGGVPRAGFVMTGDGNDNELVAGETHRVTMGMQQSFDTTATGTLHEEEIGVTIDTAVTIDTLISNSPAYLVRLREDFYTGSGGTDIPTLRIVLRMQDDTGSDSLRFVVDLPAGLGQNVSYGSDAYRTSVLEPIMDALRTAITGFENNISIEETQASDYANTSFIVRFSPPGTAKIDGIVSVVAPRDIASQRDVDISDRPMMEGMVTQDFDIIGEALPDGSGTWADTNTVFSFDLSHITDDIHNTRDNPLDDYVFFLVGEPTGNLNPEYLALDSGLTILSGTFESSPVEVEGGQIGGNEVDGSDEMLGGRRNSYDFTNGEEVNLFAPIFANDIRNSLSVETSMSGSDTTEFALLVEEDDFAALNLIAYRVREASDGVADYVLDSPCEVDDTISCPPVLHIDISETTYSKESLDYTNSVDLPRISASLTTTSTSADTQQDDFLQSIAAAFSEVEDRIFTIDFTKGTDTDVNIESVKNQSYNFTLSMDSQNSDLLDLFDTEVITQGQRQVGGVNGIHYIPPCIRISHVDPYGIDYFSFETDLIELDAEEGSDILNQIASNILEIAPQWNWDAENRLFESIAVTYRESQGDTGVDYPKADGTYQFNENREHGEFLVEFYAGNIVGNGTKTPTFDLTRAGFYDRFDGDGWGSYLAMRMSDDVVYLFYIGDTSTSATDQLREQIASRVPGVELIVEDGLATISPTVIGESTIFVEELYLNTEGNIEDFRRLLSDVYTQDDNNPQLPQSLPEAIQAEQPAIDFPFTTGSEPFLSNVSVSSEFDFDRTWAAGIVNFAIEYPIFAAGATFPDGSSVNSILASEIGYTFPRFTRGQVASQPYESFIERRQMAMTPEFTTEGVDSVALWADGSTSTSLTGDKRYSSLQINLSTTNNPGQETDLEDPQFTNTFYISEDYKMDIRLTGRFLNWKLSDEIDGDLESPGGKTFSQQTDWRLSGIQWDISTAGWR